MKAILRFLTLPIRIVITVFIWICALIIRISGKVLGLAAGLLLLMALMVMTYSNGAHLLEKGFSVQKTKKNGGFENEKINL